MPIAIRSQIRGECFSFYLKAIATITEIAPLRVVAKMLAASIILSAFIDIYATIFVHFIAWLKSELKSGLQLAILFSIFGISPRIITY